MKTIRPPWGKVDQYCRHVVAVGIGFALTLGVLDPVTGTIHVSGKATLLTIGTATAFQLLADYAGLSLPGPKGRAR